MPSVLIRNFPEELHRMAKIQAAVENITMKALIERAVTEYLKRAGVPVDEED
ncbi:MAG TPA: hypothetical protein PK250_18540 [Syntrophobacter fumaroxidans]|nr:hypothetical protein [Syntrophobacter fumaroxidans]